MLFACWGQMESQLRSDELPKHVFGYQPRFTRTLKQTANDNLNTFQKAHDGKCLLFGHSQKLRNRQGVSHHSINIWKNLLDTSWDNNAVVTLIMALAACSVHGTLMSSASSAGGGWNGNVSVVSSPCPKATSQEEARGADRRLEDIPLNTPFRKTCEEVVVCEAQVVETQEQHSVPCVLFFAKRLRVKCAEQPFEVKEESLCTAADRIRAQS